MNSKIILVFTVLIGFQMHCQETKKQFPQDFVGVYKGQLNYETPNGIASIPMEFHLKKTDSVNTYDYWLVYDGKPREYSLIVLNEKRGTCKIDENNGIILPARFYKNTLYSWFEVSGNKLTSRLQFEGETLFFEILFSALKNKTTTGGVKEVPKVFGYPISSVQKAVLKKTN